MIICRKCLASKADSDFWRAGHRICKECDKAQMYDWRRRNAERLKEYRKAYGKKWRELKREELREYHRKWSALNVETVRAKNKAWKQANPDKRAAQVRGRQARLARAYPSWANKELIGAFYERARELTLLTGIAHHVDHIVPLRSPIVCGLHNEFNLQVLSAIENVKKHNKFAEVS